MNDNIGEFKHICGQLGWKFTPQRYAVFQLMSGNRKHPSADEVCGELRKTCPGIRRDSVYRILNDFAQGGLIAKMPFTEPVRFDCCPRRHDHFFCRECGKIVDFEWELPAEELKNIGLVQTLEVRAGGVCCDCLKKHEE